jgi:hypothetical protein
MADKSGKVAASSPDSFDLTLQEFCIRLSRKDKRVEMIGAFHATEKKAGRQKDSESNFQSRFDAFCKQPA